MQIATVVAPVKNFGASGFLNVWNPEVAPDQLSSVGVFVAKNNSVAGDDTIAAGWAVTTGLLTDYSLQLI